MLPIDKTSDSIAVGYEDIIRLNIRVTEGGKAEIWVAWYKIWSDTQVPFQGFCMSLGVLFFVFVSLPVLSVE